MAESVVVSEDKCDDESDVGDEAGGNDGDDDRNDDIMSQGFRIRTVQNSAIEGRQFPLTSGSSVTAAAAAAAAPAAAAASDCRSTGQHAATRRLYMPTALPMRAYTYVYIYT